ncbi:MAG: peroxiredoxin [Chloroflexota bacterium]|nr:peroxiredoxin [Chloroflexota bacterium]|tara:strand:- start:71 stop:538 length:468 start_codon:yes stop_codon:yes gene_type:complete
MSIEIGDKCPSFELINTSGVKKKLNDYYEKLLVIYFYPKDNTPGCTKESCKFRDIYSEFKELDCEVIGISADNNDSHVNFSNNFNLNFDLLSDVDYRVSKEFGTFFVSEQFGNSIKRETYLIDKTGIVIRAWKDIKDPENHPIDVLEFVQNRVKT